MTSSEGQRDVYFEIGFEGGCVTVFQATIGNRAGFWEESNTALLDDLLANLGEAPEDTGPKPPKWLGATFPEAVAALDFKWWRLSGMKIKAEAKPTLQAEVKRRGGNWEQWSRFSDDLGL